MFRRSKVGGLTLVLATGAFLGVLLAAGTGKLISGMRYGVGALDPLAFTIAPAVLAAAALLATWLPARRATHGMNTRG